MKWAYCKRVQQQNILLLLTRTANLGLVLLILFVQYSQSDLPPLRPLSGEDPGRDSNPGRADLETGTIGRCRRVAILRIDHSCGVAAENRWKSFVAAENLS